MATLRSCLPILKHTYKSTVTLIGAEAVVALVIRFFFPHLLAAFRALHHAVELEMGAVTFRRELILARINNAAVAALAPPMRLLAPPRADIGAAHQRQRRIGRHRRL